MSEWLLSDLLHKIHTTGQLIDANNGLSADEFQNCIFSEDSGIDSALSNESLDSNTILSVPCHEESTDPSSLLLGSKYTDEERIQGINNALQWLKNELIQMKQNDKDLIKTMMDIRSNIAKVKIENEFGEDIIVVYYSENEVRHCDNNDEILKERRRLVSNEDFIPGNSNFFDKGKRATWTV